jgi:TIR domain
MNHELQIFLSHKKGDSERNAQHIAGDLALFGGPNVKVICSANFEPGENWEQKIRQGLTNSSWLVLLYTGPHTEWDWCLFETGFFRALMGEQESRRLICLHDPLFAVPAPLRSFVSVPAVEGKVFELFEDIYLHEPWRINPRIFENNRDAVKDAARRVCEAARFGAGPKHSLRVAPLVNVRIKKNQIYELDSGRIPPSATVTGEGGWETIFGKPEATAGWTWGELMGGIDKTSAWEYQICSMMAEAIKTRSVQYPSIALRISLRAAQEAEDIYRIGLGRLSEFEEEYEFVFILFRVRTPFEPSEDDRETMLYHLFNLAWHFRRRFVERHRQTMEDLADQQKLMRHGNTEDLQNELAEAVRSIKIDLKSLEADAQVRGFDRAAKVRRAFHPSERDKLDQLLNIEWPPLQKRLEEAIKTASPSAQEIHGILTEMEPINRWFYQRSVAQLSGIADANDPS